MKPRSQIHPIRSHTKPGRLPGTTAHGSESVLLLVATGHEFPAIFLRPA